MKSERVKELEEKFSLRLDVVHFTEDGAPDPDEISLTRDIWNSISSEEQKEISERIRKQRAIELDTPIEFVPEQTPYAMRLLFWGVKQLHEGQPIS